MLTRLTDYVTSFLQSKPLKHHIGGADRASVDGRTADVINPSDGKAVAQVAMASAADVDAAVQAAQAALPAWAKLTAAARAERLHRWADLMEKHLKDFAQLESLDVGKPIAGTESWEIASAIDSIRYFADMAVQAQYSVPVPVKNIDARTYRVPYGVCGFILPWNYPLVLFTGGVAPAMAAGNTVVTKPSEITPLTTLLAAKLATESGMPAGVLNIVVGDGASAGAPLVNHPLVKRVSFTGSARVGRKIGESCGERLVPCKLELGGKGAAVVFDDVDPDATAAALAGILTLNTGQVCCTATRWIIQGRVCDRIIGKTIDLLRGTKIGPGLDSKTEMGPLVSALQRSRVLDYVDRGKSQQAQILLDGGATTVAGAEGGFYVSPVVLSGPESNVCFREEIFGPVAFVTRFDDEAEALRQVNSLDYGLANSVWTADLVRANRVAEAMVGGNSWINAHNVFASGLPYRNAKGSGIGAGTYSVATFQDYLRDQTIARPL